MKKNFIYMLAVALISMCMVACSSGDDSASNENTTPQKGDIQVILKGRIEKPVTRSTVDDQGNSEWQNGDQIAVRYQKNNDSYGVATATITASGVTWADFTATLTSPKTGDSNVTLVYPYSAYNSTAPSFIDYTQLSTQYGTLADIGENRNIQSNTATVNVSGTTATLKASVLLNTNVCISKFVLKDGNGNAVNADGLKIKYGDTEKYTVTPAAATNTFYVAMEEYSGNVSIELLGVKNYPELSAPSSLPEYGEFIVVKTDDATHQAYIERSSAANKILNTTEATLTAGEFYNQNLTVSGYERIAVTAHVGEVTNYCNHFIALALEDVYSVPKTLSEAQTLIGQPNNWVVQHKLKIDNQTYSTLVGAEKTGTEKGRYDKVQDNEINASYQMTTSHASATSESLTVGWRLPTVTDMRYIFQDLKNGNNYVMNHSLIDADTPAGITDHEGYYYSTQTGYKRYNTGNDPLEGFINTLCGNSNLKGEFYWLSSKVINKSGSEQSGKAWRFSFSADQFIWNEANDQSLARLVFAY